MPSKGVDIKYKCHSSKSGKNKCACKDDDRIEVKEGALKYTDEKETDYEYCIHWSNSYELWIDKVTYGGRSLHIDNNGDGSSTPFSTIHPVVWEATTYYHTDYDKDDKEIKKPLLLRLKEVGDKVHWYENTGRGGKNTRWKVIQNGEKRFYPYGSPTDALKRELDRLTCDLHQLHIVDIHKTKDYNCPCDKAKVKVTEDKTDRGILGYTKYTHKYRTDKNPVRYKNFNLKDNGTGEPLTLTLKDTPNLSVYYWDQDKSHRKPLLMEVTLGGIVEGMKVLICNDGYPDNSKWVIIDPEDVSNDGLLTISPTKLEKKLQELKCRLFHPAIINVSVKNRKYENQYYKKEMKGQTCANNDCPKKIEVTGCSEVKLTNYTALKHTYGEQGETFTITGFTGELNIYEKELPIWDVTELVVFFPKSENESPRAINKHILVYVSSNSGRTKKWYSRTSGGKSGKLEDISSKLNKQHEIRNIFQDTLDIIKQLQGSLTRSENGKGRESHTDEDGDEEEEEEEDEETSPVRVLAEKSASPDEVGEKDVAAVYAKAETGASGAEQEQQDSVARSENFGGTDQDGEGEKAFYSSDGRPTEALPALQSATILTQAPQRQAETAKLVVESTVAATSLWLTFGTPSGTLAGSAATFFGGWKLYNRYKGDPWVRQI